MSEEKSSSTKSLVLGIVIGVAVVIAACILAMGFDRIANGFGKMASGFGSIAKPDRIVSVRGLSEREVDADMAIWPLSFSLGNNEMSALQADIVRKTEVAVNYLKQHGLTEADFTVQAPSITDTTLQEYGVSERVKYNYLARQTILVRSRNIKAVKEAQGHSLDLMSNEIVIQQNYDNQIQFEYTALNSIKPEMIGEATKNARAAAEQFASDSGSTVGKIKTATQGWFSIEDAAVGLEERKKVRVVTTIEYILTD